LKADAIGDFISPHSSYSNPYDSNICYIPVKVYNNMGFPEDKDMNDG